MYNINGCVQNFFNNTLNFVIKKTFQPIKKYKLWDNILTQISTVLNKKILKAKKVFVQNPTILSRYLQNEALYKKNLQKFHVLGMLKCQIWPKFHGN